MPLRTIGILVLLAGAARASSVTNEISATSAQTTETAPRAGTLGDALNASFDLSDAWTLNLGAMLTVQGETAAQERGGFGSSSGAVTSFNAGVDFTPADEWTLGATVSWSPRSTQYTATQVPLTISGALADALLRSETSEIEGALDLSYDTLGDSPLEWSFSAGIATTHLETDQQVTAVRTARGGTATAQDIRDICATRRCPRALLAALRQSAVQLDSQRLDVSATAIVSTDTDLTLSAAYWIYDEDPAQVGYYSLATTGRVGTGVPIAPLRFTVRPEVTRRFGAFSARLWLQLGQYVEGAGQGTTSAGLRLQYRFSKAFRLWIAASGQRDVDEQGVGSRSGTLSLGAGYRF